MALQEKNLANFRTDLESMKFTETSLKSELGTALLSRLSVEDQREIDKLNDEITQLSDTVKEAMRERSKVTNCIYN